MSLKTSAVPSIFAWKPTSPRKRPPPAERPYQQQRNGKKSVPEKECFSVSSEPEMLLSKTPEAVNDIPETSTNETITLGIASTSLDEMPSTEKDRNETLKQIRLLEKKCADLENAVSELEDKNQALQSNVFSLSRFFLTSFVLSKGVITFATHKKVSLVTVAFNFLKIFIL